VHGSCQSAWQLSHQDAAKTGCMAAVRVHGSCQGAWQLSECMAAVRVESACSYLTCQQANLCCHKGQKGWQLDTPLCHGNSCAHALQRGPFPPPLDLTPKVLQENKDLMTRPCLLDVVLPVTPAGLLLLLYVMLIASFSPTTHHLTEHARTMLQVWHACSFLDWRQ